MPHFASEKSSSKDEGKFALEFTFVTLLLVLVFRLTVREFEFLLVFVLALVFSFESDPILAKARIMIAAPTTIIAGNHDASQNPPYRIGFLAGRGAAHRCPLPRLRRRLNLIQQWCLLRLISLCRQRGPVARGWVAARGTRIRTRSCINNQRGTIFQTEVQRRIRIGAIARGTAFHVS